MEPIPSMVHPTSHRLRLGLLLAVLPLVVACSSSSSATTPTRAPTAGATATAAPAQAGAVASSVNMTDALKFDPATLTVPKGTTVTWHNTSSVQHTVTDDPSKAANKADAVVPSGAEPWDSGTIDPGQTFQHTFDTPGTYKYFCIPHEAAGMVGTITVTG
jgi:plastocyanin